MSDYNFNDIFDDIVAQRDYLTKDRIDSTEKFILISNRIGALYELMLSLRKDNVSLQEELGKKCKVVAFLEDSMLTARKMLDKERMKRMAVTRAYNDLNNRLTQMQALLTDIGSNVPLDTKKRLLSLSQPCEEGVDLAHHNHGRLNCSVINETNGTGSLLSNFSYSRSEDDLDESIMCKGEGWVPLKTHVRPSEATQEAPAPKKRRSSTSKQVEVNASETLRAVTTVTMSRNGPISAKSHIEAVPCQTPIENVLKVPINESGTPIKREGRPPTFTPKVDSALVNNNVMVTPLLRQVTRILKQEESGEHSPGGLASFVHTLQQKIILKPHSCRVCDKRIAFGKAALKCKICRILCHLDCKKLIAKVSCVPQTHTPNYDSRNMGKISDYTPLTPPMVPAILIHCINEIELRGLSEIGLYRVSGAEKDVKDLKEKFMRGKSVPCLDNVDIHAICGTVKDFLRNLSEPLVPYSIWSKFYDDVKQPNINESAIELAFLRMMTHLPPPNRDTLAYLIRHLQKIADSAPCKMPAGNLSKIFGPTIVGYSSNNLDAADVLSQSVQQAVAMEHFLRMPRHCWSQYLEEPKPSVTNHLQQTPSTDSLLRPFNQTIMSPSRNRTIRRQRFFATPPKTNAN